MEFTPYLNILHFYQAEKSAILNDKIRNFFFEIAGGYVHIIITHNLLSHKVDKIYQKLVKNLTHWSRTNLASLADRQCVFKFN